MSATRTSDMKLQNLRMPKQIQTPETNLSIVIDSVLVENDLHPKTLTHQRLAATLNHR